MDVYTFSKKTDYYAYVPKGVYNPEELINKQIFNEVKNKYPEIDDEYIQNNFKAQDVVKVTCYGCLYEHGNQEAHMDCPSGCLHDHTMCILCSEFDSGKVTILISEIP